ncbi:hypothetical protein D9615_004315 [Tricholomella constricta]|uniref:Selenoprotein O n=1 Tax=Tricholomella constricta TaxID=117010 RepID=A0A8H5HFA6_9AGAR|nr:hypothetical protein D9615_004315 [Tricholomella constricta]
MSLSSATMSAKHSIAALPLASPAQLLIHRLTPDTHTPSISVFRNKVLADTPSLQRRARLLPPPSHFSFVNPLPIPFPYDIEPTGEPVQNKADYIEHWLAAREAIHERHSSNSSLRIYDPKNRDQPRILIGLSETGLRDCVPHLDVGDAFALLGAPSLSGSFDQDGDPSPSDSEEVVKARDQLVDVLSGHSVLMTPPETKDENAFAPWSLRYSGHQFGSWAGQLGDGRAISVLVTPHPANPQRTYELQLKGAGRTPFSRTADGLAVIRSSIREYLCSEAMHALAIPTTRSLSLISLPALPVARERIESACVLTRMAPSFLRIGSFEALNGPTNMFFFGGGQQEPHWDALRILGEWVAGPNVLGLDIKEGEAWGRELVLEIARRNARMVAGWQAYGFMHGVINTDNVSVLGLTIDYGPYAFMDVFDSFHICNHSDEGGRYAYKYQPNMIIYALRALLNALAPLIGAETELGGKAAPPGWADGASKEKLEAWRAEGLKLRDELERVAQETTALEYGRLMRKRLGLRREEATDEENLFRPLLELLERQRLDFHGTFRVLRGFRGAWFGATEEDKEMEKGQLEEFVGRLLAGTPEPERLDHATATGEWLEWLEAYAQRVKGEEAEWGGPGVDLDGEREKAMRAVNPRFVLRQWVLEEVIGKVERDAESGRRVLAKVMHMACNPFEPWGAEDERAEEELDKEELEERRFCGMGEKKMLGFQCSCSS